MTKNGVVPALMQAGAGLVGGTIGTVTLPEP